MVRLLLGRGTDVNATDGAAGTALHAAAGMGHKEIVGLLLAEGADPDARTRSGTTALQIAQAMGRTEVAELLREQEASATRGRPNVPAYRGPYDNGVAEGRTGGPRADGRSSAPSDVLADPNAIRRKVASFAGLAATLEALDTKSGTEQRSWRQVRDNRTSVLRSAHGQFEEEMTVLKAVATKENATNTSAAIDDLLAQRQTRYDEIYDVLREQRRAAILAEREANESSRGRGRGRGRGVESTRGSTTPTHVYASPVVRDPNAPPLDAETEALLQVWQTNTEDKRPVLEKVLETDLNDLNGLREVAVEDNAAETTAAIEGLMVARQQRRDEVFERMAADEERQRRREERLNARERSAEGETGTSGRGRRGR
jgi:hypothetical protein